MYTTMQHGQEWLKGHYRAGTLSMQCIRSGEQIEGWNESILSTSWFNNTYNRAGYIPCWKQKVLSVTWYNST